MTEPAGTVLDVPHYVQPTSNTCQSTCLKMMASHLDVQTGRAVRHRVIQNIWNTINTGSARPVKQRNSYRNMRWWLEKQFPAFHFTITTTASTKIAAKTVIDRINAGFPLMVSTNHTRTKGHIILVIGYEGAGGSTTGDALRFVCHDPYGKFDPILLSKQYGGRRFEGGQTLTRGEGENGPGKAVVYDIAGLRRVRSDQHSPDTFYLIAGNDRICAAQ